ncbi:hypothetical protein ZEAMMB73_Zm00001d000113 [Zea mays]|nr:hypothetical protein ZEAMMB73_Zm00001d000113 [Zea mays]
MQYGLQLFTMLSSYDCIIYDLLRIRINPSIFLLHSAAGPHTIVDGKEVVNFASANYLGLIGNEKIIESCISSLEKLVLVLVVHVVFMEQLMSILIVSQR